MAALELEPEKDALAHLEERVEKAVGLVIRLREENAALVAEKAAAAADLAELEAVAERERAANQKLNEEIEALRAERGQVRNRLERLLGHIDQLGAA